MRCFVSFRWLIASAALCSIACSGQGSASYPPFSDSSGELAAVRVAADLAYRADPSGSLTFNEVWRDRQAWSPHRQQTPTFGYTAATIWLRFSVENRGPEAAPLVLLINNEYIDRLEVYGVRVPARDGEIPVAFQFTGGRELPFYERELPDRKYAFPIVLGGASRYEVLLSARSGNSLNVPVFVLAPKDYGEMHGRENLRMGLYGGLFVLLFVANLASFFALRERLFLLYVAYLLFSFLYQFSLQGYAYKYLWPGAPGWAGIFNILAFCPSVSMAGLFCREFLELRRRHPITDRIVLVQVVWWALLPLGLLFVSPGALEDLMARALGPAVIITNYAAGWQAYRSGYLPARFYVVAWSLYLPFTFFYVLQINGVLPNGFLGVDMLENLAIGISLEMLIFPFAIADRMRLALQNSRERSAGSKTRPRPAVDSARASRLNVDEVSRGLREAMQVRKIYREELTLVTLAAEIGLKEKDLSSYLNDVRGQSFYAFLNEYRVAEAKNLLLNKPEEKIVAIAHAVGYQSLSTFHEAFRKLVGMTPREFRKRDGSD